MIEHHVPLVIVPGLGGSPAGHWQRLWADRFPDATLLEQEDWNEPDFGIWFTRLHAAIAESPGAFLIGHSLGAILVANLAARVLGTKVSGALLVAPADIERCAELQDRTASFRPLPQQRLPFPSAVVASTSDPYVSFERARRMAETWGSAFHGIGDSGHINIASGHGEWPEGELILEELCSSIGKDQDATQVRTRIANRSHLNS